MKTLWLLTFVLSAMAEESQKLDAMCLGKELVVVEYVEEVPGSGGPWHEIRLGSSEVLYAGPLLAVLGVSGAANCPNVKVQVHGIWRNRPGNLSVDTELVWVKEQKVYKLKEELAR